MRPPRSGLTPATPDRQTSPADVICVPAAHPPFAGAQPGVASHASPRFSSYRLPVPRLSLFLLLSRYPSHVRLVLAQQSNLCTSKRQTAARDAGPGLPQPDICDIRESALQILLCGDSFRCPLLLGLEVLTTLRVLKPPVYSGTGLFTHFHATPITTPAIAALAARSSACDWRLDRSGRPHPRRIVSRPARRNPTQEPFLLQ